MNRPRCKDIAYRLISVVLLFIILWMSASLLHAHVLYQADVYDCSDMSEWQYDVFNVIPGIEATYVWGVSVNESNPHAFNDDAHMWLRLNIFGCKCYWESVTFMPNTGQRYFDAYDVILVGNDIEHPDTVYYPHGNPWPLEE